MATRNDGVNLTSRAAVESFDDAVLSPIDRRSPSSFASELESAMTIAGLSRATNLDYHDRHRQRGASIAHDSANDPLSPVTPNLRAHTPSPVLPPVREANVPQGSTNRSMSRASILEDEDSWYSTIVDGSDLVGSWYFPPDRERDGDIASGSERRRASDIPSARSTEVHPRFLRDRARRNAMQSTYPESQDRLIQHQNAAADHVLVDREDSTARRVSSTSMALPGAHEPPVARAASPTADGDTVLEGTGIRTPSGPPASSRRSSTSLYDRINLNQYRDGPFRDTLLRTQMYGASRGGRLSVAGESASIRAPLPVYRPPSQATEALHLRRSRPSAPRPPYIGAPRVSTGSRFASP